MLSSTDKSQIDFVTAANYTSTADLKSVVRMIVEDLSASMSGSDDIPEFNVMKLQIAYVSAIQLQGQDIPINRQSADTRGRAVIMGVLMAAPTGYVGMALIQRAIGHFFEEPGLLALALDVEVNVH